MEMETIHDRVHDASDDDPNIHAIINTGSEENITYFLIIATKRHDDMDMLKVRYFAAHQDDQSEDTWMQNGITARSSDMLITKLKEVFALMDGGLTADGEMTKLIDLSEDLP